MRDASDEQLMVEYGKGSMAAFEVLYARHRVALYRYFMRVAGNTATANDLYQGCWEKVIKARRRYSAKAPFQAWLFRIARNHHIDHLRSQRPTAELDPQQADPDSVDNGENLDQQQRELALRSALAALPEEQRDALVLKLDAGLDLQTIAAVTGVGVETAKSRLRYATRSLKQALQA